MKLQKLNAQNWQAEAVKLLKENFTQIHTAFVDATKRAVWMGMFLNYIKQKGKEDKSIPHGEFGPWLEKNVPEISRDTVTTYMNLATGVCEKGKFQITDFPQFAESGHLPPQIEKMVEGKTQQQLFLDFRGGSERPAEPKSKTKLSPTQQHAAFVKNIEADGEHCELAMERLLQMNLVNFKLLPPGLRKSLVEKCGALKRRLTEN